MRTGSFLCWLWGHQFKTVKRELVKEYWLGSLWREQVFPSNHCWRCGQLNNCENETAHKLERILTQLTTSQEKLLMDLSSLQAAFAAFSADFSTFATDVQAKLAALAANQQNPADQQVIDDISAGIGTLDTQVKAMDQALNPPA